MQKRGRNFHFLLVRPGVAKRGQFYLVAAIIIAAIVMSLIVTTNYSKKQDYVELESLRDEILIEGMSILDYSLNNEETVHATHIKMWDFSEKYSDLESRDKSLYFIFGTTTNLTLYGSQRGGFEVVFDGNAVTSEVGEFSLSINPGVGNVVLKIDEESYPFVIESGQNFYFIITKEADGGNYVVTG